MFTGIIESLGIIRSKVFELENMILEIESPISKELKIDQSVAHNGICLTVFELGLNSHKVCAVPETIAKTSISSWQLNDELNLERCMQLNGRLDGHIVQGHVDSVATCVKLINHENHWNFTFEFDEAFTHFLVEKGSITINGTSLTCFNVLKNSFEIAIIPYTYHNTNFKQIVEGSLVNLEFDIIGKYVARMMNKAK